MTILDKFNFSYSTYETWCKSPLWFYFMKIAKNKESDKGMQVYGDAGNVVHNALQDYYEGKGDTFKHHWISFNIESQTGFRNTKLDYTKFLIMYNSGVDYIDENNLKGKGKAELEIYKKLSTYPIKIRGFIDLFIETEKGDIVIRDWKTNSKHDYKMHLKQRLLYSWVIYQITGKIPLCKWVYLKDMDVVEDRFTVDELSKFYQDDMCKFAATIEECGDDIKNYPVGDYKNPFNKYFTLCSEELERRETKDSLQVHMVIKGNYIFFEGDMNPKLEQGIDFKTKFDLPDKYWMQQKVKEKARGRINLEDVGTVHLYNKKFKCFPIGLLDPITKICNEFGEHYNKEVKIFLDDKRDPKILNRTLGIMPRILYTKNELRDYQLEAINQFMAKEAGIINIATGGGKTLVATEIIRKLDAKTLWIIDRKELLVQTRDTLKELLGIPIGTISGGKVDIQDVTIATIQSLSSKIVDLQDYLYNVNFVVVDEYHKSAAATYQKVFAKLPNTKYRLGLTATAMRDDGKTPILFSLLGEIIYKCTSSDLIDMGYLVKPTIEFYDLNGFGMFDEKYSDDYRMNVVESNDRNNKIKDIVELNPNKKIMILTKQVEHGKRLKESIPEATYLHGTLGNETRTRIMESFRLGIFNTLIMTQSIGAEGLDIPDLDIIINAAANKGDVKSIQVLGRVLRIFNNKSEARYIDFVDIGKHTRKHSEARMLAFKEQGHTVVKR